jgi:hypothetical protein
MGASVIGAGAGASAAGAWVPSDFTVCFFAHPTDIKAATDNANTTHFQEIVTFILFPSFSWMIRGETPPSKLPSG